MVEEAEIENLEFRWGKKRGIGGKKKDVQFYESFAYDGVEYTLYDSVYLYKEEEPEPYIGKLIKIWENADKTKRVKVLWFFRPSEISNFLGNDQTPENELFLACGEGVGLTNVNPLEAIAGKCNVVCTSKDNRNPQPSAEELQMSDFIFYRTFDVGLHKVLNKIDEKIARIEVKFLLNKVGCQNSSGGLKVDSKKDIDKNATASDGTLISAQKNIPESVAAKMEGVFVDTSGKEHGKPSLVKQKSLLSEKPASNVDVESGGIAMTSEGLEDVSTDSTTLRSKVKENSHTKISSVKQKSALGERVPSGEGAGIGEIVRTNRLENLLSNESASSSKVEFETSKGKGGKVLEVKEDIKSTKDCGELDNRPCKRSRLDSSVEVYDDKIKNHVQNLGRDSNRNGAKPKLGIIDSENISKTKVAKPSYGIDGGSSKKQKVDEKLIKPTNGKVAKTSYIQPSWGEKKTDKRILEVARRPNLDRSKWFKELPWEERMRVAHEQGTLVLLENLDPSYTSIEVEDIVWHAFKENCSAKMIQRITFSSTHSGQAYVIFKTREAAEKVVTKLDEGCLMLSNRRPLVGSVRTPRFTGKQSTFVGYLVIDKLKFQMQREMREAVSTSHCSQPNTLEYDMAIEWCMLQEKLDCAWKKLYEQQGQELRKLRAKLKPK